MDCKALAEALTQILAPALPRLITNSLEGSSGTTVDMDRAKTIWSRLYASVEGSPATTEAVRDLAKDPEDLDAQAFLRIQLRKLLERDKVLTAEMARLVESNGVAGNVMSGAAVYGSGAIAQSGRAVAAGGGGIAIGGNVWGGIQVGPLHARDRD